MVDMTEHPRTGGRRYPEVDRAYLGTAETFDRAMGDFALAYADQTAEDHRALARAIEAGRVEAATES
ncbi:Uncharacterized protein conserved in bacteria [Nocardia otitidiscaviarum]|uniref:Uncharacterized protein conserved in bacteria n=2 Tax=Nocardia otitidiscaviarum TaxID=1823 RepID=A0A378YMT4_9NOCA|nr:Uncharacterized protein conserved in bacteria [Nocardia otitidiscaviarum]